MKTAINNIKISVIIVAYNKLEILLNAIESLFQFNDLEDEIEVIVVDNSDANNDIETYFKNNTTNVIYIKNDNKGFGEGNNIGAKVAKGEIFAFINSDIIFIEPIFKNIYKEFIDDENIKIIGCKLMDNNMKPNFSYFIDYDDSFIKRLLLKVFVKFDYFNQKYMYISGSNLFIRKNAFFESGMFDERIFLYYEEPDITRRIKEKYPNCVVKYNRNNKLIHLEGKTTSNINTDKYEIESLVYYGKKYGLDFLKKLKFEYRYRKCKGIIKFILNNKDYRRIIESSNKFKNEYNRLINGN